METAYCSDNRDRRWHVYKAIEQLEAAERKYAYQIELTDPVVSILKLWATSWAGQPTWQSLLNKREFLHEVEESMVALYYLNRWRNSVCTSNIKFVAVDVCGGKGIFSMLLQYMGALYWNSDRNGGGACLDRIILLEKATREQIDWSHLESVPPAESKLNGPIVPVHLWDDCNLHDYDALVTRFELSVPRTMALALTGIHLCKLLSPAMISLANLLGSEWCPYVCLAPCCMPRVVTAKHLSDSLRRIPILGFESAQQRKERNLRIQLKRSLKRKGRDNGTNCFLCHSPDHWIRQCPQFPDQSAETKIQLLQAAAAATPCWNCGLTGHFKDDCRAAEKIQWQQSLLVPPVARTIQVPSPLSVQDPFLSYCRLLMPSLEDREVELVEADLKNGDKHRSNNWNSCRKSIYILAVAAKA